MKKFMQLVVMVGVIVSLFSACSTTGSYGKSERVDENGIRYGKKIPARFYTWDSWVTRDNQGVLSNIVQHQREDIDVWVETGFREPTYRNSHICFKGWRIALNDIAFEDLAKSIRYEIDNVWRDADDFTEDDKTNPRDFKIGSCSAPYSMESQAIFAPDNDIRQGLACITYSHTYYMGEFFFFIVVRVHPGITPWDNSPVIGVLFFNKENAERLYTSMTRTK